MTAGWDADKLVADAKEQLRQGDARLATAYATVAIAYATVAIAEAIMTHLRASPALCRTETGGFCHDHWGARGHLCTLENDHNGGHECACGHRWREVDE